MTMIKPIVIRRDHFGSKIFAAWLKIQLLSDFIAKWHLQQARVAASNINGKEFIAK